MSSRARAGSAPPSSRNPRRKGTAGSSAPARTSRPRRGTDGGARRSKPAAQAQDLAVSTAPPKKASRAPPKASTTQPAGSTPTQPSRPPWQREPRVTTLNAGGDGALSADKFGKVLKWSQAKHWLHNVPFDLQALRAVKEEQVTVSSCCGLFSSKRSACEVPGLPWILETDRDLVFTLHGKQWNTQDPMHFKLLSSVHAKLTGSEDCLPAGPHFLDLGFSDEDPAKDLGPGGGLLGVALLLHYADRCREEAQAVVKKLAARAVGGFPLAVVCFRITEMVVRAFIAGKLSKLCVEAVACFEPVCMVHTGALLHFTAEWVEKRMKGDRPQELESALQDVRAHIFKHSRALASQMM